MGTSKSATKPFKGDEDKKEKRRAANRRSARKSRYREMVMLDELQRSSQELAKKNLSLQESNEQLRKVIAAIKNAKIHVNEHSEKQFHDKQAPAQNQNPMLMLLASAAGRVQTQPMITPNIDMLSSRLGNFGTSNLIHQPAVPTAPHPILFSQLAPYYAQLRGIESQLRSAQW